MIRTTLICTAREWYRTLIQHRHRPHWSYCTRDLAASSSCSSATTTFSVTFRLSPFSAISSSPPPPHTSARRFCRWRDATETASLWSLRPAGERRLLWIPPDVCSSRPVFPLRGAERRTADASPHALSVANRGSGAACALSPTPVLRTAERRWSPAPETP